MVLFEVSSLTLPKRMWAGSLLGPFQPLNAMTVGQQGRKSIRTKLGRGGGDLPTFLLLLSSIDCLYTNTTYLEVNFRVDVIKPGKSMEIPITFYPRESISYRELIPFEINGLSQHVVEIKGKGTEMKVRGGPQTGSFPALPSPLGPPEPLPPSPRPISCP